MTTKEIPDYPRYKMVSEKVADYIYEENIIEFPIDVFALIENRIDTRLISYKDAARYSESLGQKFDVKMLKNISADGFTLYNSGFYNVLYNEEKKSDRLLFTLAHELGHIVLNHIIEFEQTSLSRGGLNVAKHKVLEHEANAFARNLICPVNIVKAKNLDSEFKLTTVFGISHQAGSMRLKMLDKDLANIKTHVVFLNAKFKKFLNSYRCSNCKSEFLLTHTPNFCSICGSNRPFWKYNPLAIIFPELNSDDEEVLYEMKYPKIEVDENGKAFVCPTCSNEEINARGEYCHICGTYLINKCEGLGEWDSYGQGFRILEDGCGEILDGNARYCPFCGKPSTFFNNDVLKAWDHKDRPVQVQYQNDDEVPF